MCKSFLTSLDYHGSTYYTMGVDNYSCDIFTLYYDNDGNQVADSGLASKLKEKGRNQKRVFNCGDQ